ncbi:AAA family ATPase [Micromonospora arborensis]|uniref:AAA family ATPase n=1 Tax=Micromonospora arborensis TaxID=2116518 RepID=UPI0033F3D6F0
MTDQNRPGRPTTDIQPDCGRRDATGHRRPTAATGANPSRPLGEGRTLIITRGLPGSGKSTWAISLGHTRLNRDSQRDALHGVRDHTPKHEQEVTIAQHAAVAALLRADVTVVVDDTNIYQQDLMQWEDLAERCAARLIVADQFLHVPVEECIRRQAARPENERVPAESIERMAAEIERQRANAETADAAISIAQGSNREPGQPAVQEGEAIVYWLGPLALAGNVLAGTRDD